MYIYLYTYIYVYKVSRMPEIKDSELPDNTINPHSSLVIPIKEESIESNVSCYINKMNSGNRNHP
jgi:hypothetical protein